MEGRECTKCGAVKDRDQFIPSRGDKSVLTRMCKGCRDRAGGYYKKRRGNHEFVLKNRKRVWEYQKRMEIEPEWVERERQRKLEYYHRMKGSTTAKKAQRASNARRKKRYANDPLYRINTQMRNAISHTLAGRKKGRRWECLVGYTREDLVAHLASLLEEGMTLENYGEWTIDHRTPISWFSYESAEDEEFKKCWALDNLKPMWASENFSKGNRYAD